MKLLIPVCLAAFLVAFAAACGDDDERLSDEEYFEEVDALDAGVDAAFEEAFGAESAKAGLETIADAIDEYASGLDDINPPEDVEDAHNDLRDAAQEGADNVREIADSASEDAPPEEIETLLFGEGNPFADVDPAIQEVCAYAEEQEITTDTLCEGEGEEESVDPSTLPAEETTEVLIEDFSFQPAHIQVSVGDTVTWTLGADGAPHDATADDGSFATDILEEEGATGEVTFEEAGAFSYFCSIHPDMLGLVTVVE
jgi:plastocyanin